MHGKKTYLAALAVIVLAALEQTDVVKLWNDPKAALTALGMAVLMGALRYLTQITTVSDALHAVPPEHNEQ